MGQTYSNCPEAVTDLQSCVCTKNNNFAAISRETSSSVSYTCGSTATDDLASAYTALDQYCDQSGTILFPEPAHPVSMYITDLPPFYDLAPCAASALSYVVMRMTNEECPEQATLMAPCVCSRNQNSLRASQIINTSVKFSRDSHSADITSAQVLLSAYCALNDGTTIMPTTELPPGDMTYFITALPRYSSLAPCAQTAVSGVLSYAAVYHCPAGPQALASCACLKESMSTSITSSLTSGVKYYCDKTALEDISSVLGLFDYYCSAARSEVVAAGITESVGQPSVTGPLVGGGAGHDADDDEIPTSDERKSKIALIAGITGAVVALALAGVIAFFFLKRRKARTKQNGNQDPTLCDTPLAQQSQPVGGSSPAQDDFYGKPELCGSEVKPQGRFGFDSTLGSPSPSSVKINVNRMEGVSPADVQSNAYTAPAPEAAELGNSSSAVPSVAELPDVQHQHQHHGNADTPPLQYAPSPERAYGYPRPSPRQGRTPAVYEAPNISPRQQPTQFSSYQPYGAAAALWRQAYMHSQLSPYKGLGSHPHQVAAELSVDDSIRVSSLLGT